MTKPKRLEGLERDPGDRCPEKKASPPLPLLLCLALLLSPLFVWGLSIRSISSSEGRWAVIAREMGETKDIFTPTSNGTPYYDKPLLGYWVILPFAALDGGVTERAARMPSAIAGLAAVLLAFYVGRRLFGTGAGLLAGLFLGTAGMFLFRARIASADLLNLAAVWAVIACFLRWEERRRPAWLGALYACAAAGSFLKGPVAAAVTFAALGFYAAGGVILRLRNEGFAWKTLRRAVRAEFAWILSREAIPALLGGVVLFVVLLFLPVLARGDWGTVRLMWRENVVRFFEPFDHKDPPTVYLWSSLLYFAPWSLLFLAALWDARRWPAGRARRFLLLAAAGIFLFFTASGSRRSYYILPFVPAMAVMAGYTCARWLNREKGVPSRLVTGVLAALLVLCLLAPALLFGRRVRPEFPEVPGLVPVCLSAALLSLAGLLLLLRGRRKNALACLLVTVYGLELFTFTEGMAVAERQQTFRPFITEVVHRLDRVPNEEIAVYRIGRSMLTYYLGRRGIVHLETRRALRRFAEAHPKGYVLYERRLDGDASERAFPPVRGRVVVEQAPEPWRRRKRRVVGLLRLGAGGGGATGTPGTGREGG